MKRRWSLIAAIAVLSIALVFVITDIVSGRKAPVEAAPSAAASASATASATAEGGAEAAERITQPREGELARYVGTSEDGSFALAVIVWADKVIAYISDGAAQEAWLSGTVADGQMFLEGANGAVLQATVSPHGVAGSAGQGQWSVTFVVEQTEAPAGLYRAGGSVGDSEVGYGMIVLPDGRQTGIVWTDGQPESAPAFDLKTATLSDKGVTFRVDPIESDQL